MIFVDHTGRRWRRIKRSTFTIIVLASLPVAALIAGALVYHPQWGLLSLAQNRFLPQPQANPSPAPVPAAAQIKPANKTAAVSRKTTSAITSSASAPAPTITSTALPTQATSVVPSPSPVPVDPGNSDYGRSHQPTR